MGMRQRKVEWQKRVPDVVPPVTLRYKQLGIGEKNRDVCIQRVP